MSYQYPPSELIINPDGSAYHIGLVSSQIPDHIITVGDQERVSEVSKHFDKITFTKQTREFKSCGGSIGNKDVLVISTGIGTDNIDIVFNELDALANINFATRSQNEILRQLSFFRIGTSGALIAEVPLDSFLISQYAIGLDSLMHYYERQYDVVQSNISKTVNEVLQAQIPNAAAYVSAGSKDLIALFDDSFIKGITITAPGFYAPQGRQLRAMNKSKDYLEDLRKLEFEGHRITNFEMETSGIYGLAEVLGHKAISLNAMIANRATQQFSPDYKKTVNQLILKTIEVIAAQ